MPTRFGGRGGGDGATARAHTPAVALFEHPEDATATFLAAIGSTEGLTVTMREPLEYGQDTSQWSIVGAQRYEGVAGVVGVAASVDIPTSATGGIRVTAAATGTAGNNISVNIVAGQITAAFYLDINDTALLNVATGASAAAARTALDAVAQISAAFYGTETGTTVVNTGGTLLAGFGGTHDLAGGVDAVTEIEADPVHVVPDRETMTITAYYAIAAGGLITEADTLGDLKGAFDTAAEGLSSEYVGGGAATDVMSRPFATSDSFSQADLRGLRLMLTDPIAAGAAGNAFGLVNRARFPGGGEVTERQAHILIYTNTGRTGGIRVTLDADIQGLNEHGAPVDVSSGALGNEWHFVTRTGTDNNERVLVSPANRQIIFEANRLGTDETIASQVLSACNQGGTGCSATTFGGYGGSRHVFRGSLGSLNASINNFHDGRDYHAATGNAEPLAIAQGPTHAHTRLYTVADGGILLSLTNPAHDAGNGFQFESVEGDPLGVAVVRDEERVTLTVPAAGALASAILAAFNADAALSAEYFGTETGTATVTAARFGRHELLGGLDATEIEILYAPEATGLITDADTMGDIKTAWDAVDGRISFYYGGADAATVASRLVPWEHEFENGRSDAINVSGFGLGPETNEFTGADRAAAEAARNTFANANPTWVESYRGAPNVWIALRWGTNQVGQILRAGASNPPAATDWIDQDLALRGATGPAGSDAMVKDFARTGGRGVRVGDMDSQSAADDQVPTADGSGGVAWEDK